jgi:hypothetical protein
MARSSRLGALLLSALLLVVAACGGADERSDDDVAEDLSTQLQGDALGLAADDADCVADALVADLGADAVEDADIAADAPPEGDQEDFVTAVQQAFAECDVDPTTTGQ